jgi:hypothetical protein
MNQHERVENALAEHDEQATKARHVTQALVEIEEVLGMLVGFVDCGSFNERYDLTGALDRVRRAVRAVEDDQ